jgi:hypothetical protein
MAISVERPIELRPCSAYRPRQHELVPQVDKLIEVHVEADIFSGALPQDLLIYANTILAEVEVVGLWGTTPTDVDRQSDDPTCLRGRQSIIVGQGHRACAWSKLS